MAMTSSQEAAFKTASGGMEILGSFNLWAGIVCMLIFTWAAWVIYQAYGGWATGSCTAKAAGGAIVRAVLIILITMFFILS